MRKIILLMHVSLDGYAAGLNGEMDWIRYDDELEKYAHALHSTTDAAIYGRVTFDMMQSYWPTVLADPSSTGGALAHAQWYDSVTKVVISKSLKTAEWKNTVLVGDNIAEQITTMKQQPGKDMWMIGSPSTVHEFTRLGLIDEYRINVNPVVLGSGKPLFSTDPLKLNLLEAKTFKCGVVALRYERAAT